MEFKNEIGAFPNNFSSAVTKIVLRKILLRLFELYGWERPSAAEVRLFY